MHQSQNNSLINFVYKSFSSSPMARPTPMVRDGASIHKIDYLAVNIGQFKSQRKSEFNHWSKSFAEWVDFA